MFYSNSSTRFPIRPQYFAAFLFLSLIQITFQSQAFADFSKTAEEYRLKGKDEQNKGNLGGALSYFTKAASLRPNNPVILNDLGVLYEQIGSDKAAEESYLQALKSDPNYLAPYMNLAYLYKREGNLSKAIEFFETRAELGDPKDKWTLKAKEELDLIEFNLPVYRKKREAQRQKELKLEAKRKKEELKRKKISDFSHNIVEADLHYSAGQKLFRNHEFQNALNEYNQALKLTPNNPKIVKAKKIVELELTKEQIRLSSDEAIKRLNLGDADSAKEEIQKMLTAIPEQSFQLPE